MRATTGGREGQCPARRRVGGSALTQDQQHVSGARPVRAAEPQGEQQRPAEQPGAEHGGGSGPRPAPVTCAPGPAPPRSRARRAPPLFAPRSPFPCGSCERRCGDCRPGESAAGGGRRGQVGGASSRGRAGVTGGSRHGGGAGTDDAGASHGEPRSLPTAFSPRSLPPSALPGPVGRADRHLVWGPHPQTPRSRTRASGVGAAFHPEWPR